VDNSCLDLYIHVDSSIYIPTAAMIYITTPNAEICGQSCGFDKFG